MSIVDKYRHDILSKLLSLIGVSLDNLPTVITLDMLENSAVIEQFKEYIPVIRKFYSSDKLTALHSNAFEKQKNPGLNLIRQLLRENEYEIKSRNDRSSTSASATATANLNKQFVIYKLPPMPAQSTEPVVNADVAQVVVDPESSKDKDEPLVKPRIQLRVSLKNSQP